MPEKLRHKAEWLDWEIEIGYHVSRRSVQRGFSETDLRIMIADAAGFRPSGAEGRFVLHCSLGDEEWRIVVEPDYEEHLLHVVTAWRV